ncbi:hypothetical protein D3C85_727010 [compost metagenome]
MHIAEIGSCLLLVAGKQSGDPLQQAGALVLLFLKFDQGFLRRGEQAFRVLLAIGQRVDGGLAAEGQHLGAEARGGVGDRQPHQVGAFLVQVGVDLDGGVDLLALLVEGDQLRGGVNLDEQGQALLALQLDLLGPGGGDVAVHLEHAVGVPAADVLHVDAGAIGALVVALGHLLDPVAGDGAAIGGPAFNGDTEEFGL